MYVDLETVAVVHLVACTVTLLSAPLCGFCFSGSFIHSVTHILGVDYLTPMKSVKFVTCVDWNKACEKVTLRRCLLHIFPPVTLYLLVMMLQ